MIASIAVGLVTLAVAEHTRIDAKLGLVLALAAGYGAGLLAEAFHRSR